jgi:hypothetical protein
VVIDISLLSIWVVGLILSSSPENRDQKPFLFNRYKVLYYYYNYILYTIISIYYQYIPLWPLTLFTTSTSY